jgi:hypothetical protein
MNQQTFADSLRDLHAVALQSGPPVTSDQDTISAVVAKLRSTPESSPEYWPTVLQFIQFASSRFAPDVPPPGKPNVTIAYNAGFGFSFNLRNSIILLDGGDLGPPGLNTPHYFYAESRANAQCSIRELRLRVPFWSAESLPEKSGAGVIGVELDGDSVALSEERTAPSPELCKRV